MQQHKSSGSKKRKGILAGGSSTVSTGKADSAAGK